MTSKRKLDDSDDGGGGSIPRKTPKLSEENINNGTPLSTPPPPISISISISPIVDNNNEDDDEEVVKKSSETEIEADRRTSTRVQKKNVGGNQEDFGTDFVITNKKRSWEQWESEDKSLFFEALSDCGKNFDDIRVYFRNKKRLNKTKEQIRTFYYRTWHKISRFIEFPENLQKSSRELYGLINYGELRKRLGGGNLDERISVKLQELVFKGSTAVRVKGKTIRLKTPMCRALKRLNNEDDKESAESSASSHLPSKVVLDLKPLKGRDFHRVHALAFQNPHVQIKVDLQKSIKSVIKFLEKKWLPRQNHLLASLFTLIKPETLSSSSSSWLSEDDVRLSLMPRKGSAVIHKPLISPQEPLTSASLSLSSLQSKLSSIQSKSEDQDKDGGGDSESETDDNNTTTANNNHNEEVEAAEAEGCGEFESWNSDSPLTVGEVYLMFRKDNPSLNKLELNYTFNNNNNKDTNVILKSLVKLASRKQQQSIKVKPLVVVGSPPPLPAPPLVPKSTEDEFRKPVPPPTMTTMTTTKKPLLTSSAAFKQQLDLLMPKYNNRKGRPLSRKNSRISQSVRPLQPKFVMSDGPSKKLRLLPQVINTSHPIFHLQQQQQQQPQQQHQLHNDIEALSVQIEDNFLSDNNNPPPPVQLSPTESFSSLFEDPSFEGNTPSSSSSNLDTVLENSLLQTPPRQQSRPPTPPAISDHQRSLNSEPWLPELSLSSFLCLPTQQQQPTATTTTTTTATATIIKKGFTVISEDSSQSTSSEVDRQFLSMMTENSLDFTSKFAKLASHVVSSEANDVTL